MGFADFEGEEGGRGVPFPVLGPRAHKCENEKIVLLMNWLQDRDRDGRISYDEFCGKKTINEKAFEVLFTIRQMAFCFLKLSADLSRSDNVVSISKVLIIIQSYMVWAKPY